MAAVLYEWEDARQEYEQNESALFIQAHTAEAFRKKQDAIQALVEQADISIVKSYLVSALAENEKTLLRFLQRVCGGEQEEDVRSYTRQ